MFSILTKSPDSKLNGTQDKNPTLPDESDILPLKISKVPVPSFFTITSGFIVIILPTVLPNPSFLINSEISKGSFIDVITLESPSLKIVTLLERLMLIDFLSFHSLTETPSKRTIEFGRRFSEC